MQKKLYYVHDPMCSWCWGFEPTRRQLFTALEGRLQIERLVGGLAPDTDEPMPETMRNMLQQTWHRIATAIPGTEFNFDFWEKCQPRRATYPANRAIIAARGQGEEFDTRMTVRIQRAYYLEARNPSDDSTLIELAGDLGLDCERFADELTSAALQHQLLQEIQYSRMLGIDSFPSLAVEKSGQIHHIALSYTDAQAMLAQIEAI